MKKNSMKSVAIVKMSISAMFACLLFSCSIFRAKLSQKTVELSPQTTQNLQVIKDLQPAEVWQHFVTLCSICIFLPIVTTHSHDADHLFSACWPGSSGVDSRDIDHLVAIYSGSFLRCWPPCWPDIPAMLTTLWFCFCNRFALQLLPKSWRSNGWKNDYHEQVEANY